MKKTPLIAALAIPLVHAQLLCAGEPAAFTRGHIYVAFRESEACDFGGREWIIEIDPATGASRVFADSGSDPNICNMSGLRFTPDGTRLLAVNFGHYINGLDGGWIASYAPDGTSEIILDASDGLRSPSGRNALDFDRDGNLYVVSGDTQQILRFPADGGVPTVFADSEDGITFQGALSFAPNGDLFFGSSRSRDIVQIRSDGKATLFDDTSGVGGMDIDDCGNIFACGGTSVWRYDYGNPDSRRVLNSDFSNAALKAIAVSPDARSLYYGEIHGEVYQIDPLAGTFSLLSDVNKTVGQTIGLAPYGITVYAPRIVGDADRDGDSDLRDAAVLQFCWSPEGIGNACCYEVDLNDDARVDAADAATFISAMTGP